MIGERVADAIRGNGVDIAVVARAADMRPSALNARLEGRGAFTFEQLVAVGGFLHVRVSDLVKGATT